MVRVKSIVASIGISGALAAGTLTLAAAPASAASNHFVRTYFSSTSAGASGACWSDANRNNNTVSGTYIYYYCASGPTQTSGGQTLHGYNLWVRY
jgi:hypothetical protein